MNRQAKHIFDGLRDADMAYVSETTKILDAFIGKVKRVEDEGKMRKDEKEYVALHTEVARRDAQDALNAEESRFRSAVHDARASLESELDKAISAPVPSAFTERLAFYRTAQITPGRTEAASLLKLAGKSMLAVSALAKLLDDASSPVRVDAPSVEDFEADVETLRQMEEAPLHHAELAHHSEMAEVLKGTPQPTQTAEGWSTAAGAKWSGMALLLCGQGIRNQLERLYERADVWSADVSTELRERQSAAVKAVRDELAEITGEEPEQEPTSTVRISDAESEAAVEVAKELGRRNAKPNIPSEYIR